MSKYEFLNILQVTLDGEVSQDVIDENLLYYNNYIDDEIRKGKKEIDILQLLGEPRLIAKTIIETSSVTKSTRTYTYSNEMEDEMQDKTNQRGFHASYDEHEGWDLRYGKFKINSWYGKMILIILLIVVLCLVGQIAVAILPIIFPVVVIFLLVSYFTGNRR
ncbi:DUF1700 domain-containing protein [Candidatus Galacturonibacter soehngenii]|uniref:DUF1700 domain-containing protein n=1 Tax=Candidatus Galacturonatibacter soehngenii TaxID=2307010 RepID=A0A7V7QP47_9FIRM|nr:DUF1700 domain-containing protein [Candidatus Galacturonibacter soehngenii]KAB1440943.1 DUF1700 domain-containing protein [Candidatus Galacturonibacter soehngenii]MBA4688718.1 DUF1700 domain-containing protein [Candidatus Galacturonibacter soehngenii]